MSRRKKGKYVRTTVSLPESIWRKLRMESIKERKPMGDLIAERLRELERLKKKAVLKGD